jgi:hypothetical protein
MGRDTTTYKIREMHGVISLNPYTLATMKQYALILDKFYVTDLEKELFWHLQDDFASSINADLQFLQQRGIITWLAHKSMSVKQTPEMETGMEYLRTLAEQLFIDVQAGSEDTTKAFEALNVVNDVILRGLSAQLNADGAQDTVPICRADLPTRTSSNAPTNAQTVVRVAVNSLPVPDDQCAWHDILDFRTEECDKLWAFRRFLRTLTTKAQTESEIQDDIEWTLNEYAQTMKVHNLKASQSFVDVFLIAPLEIIENLVKFNWSKLAKGLLSVNKRKVELLEEEMKAAGRECAYVFDARKKFRKNP